MKKFIVGIVVMLSMSIAYGQNSSKSKNIDVLLVETQAKETTQQIIEGIIRQYIAKKPNAPKSIEQEIQKSIDYESYMKNIKAAYAEAYSELEINELIKIHKSGDQQLFKKKSERVAKPLYDIGNAFGKEVVQVIVDKLQPY
jgi:hypothetical protein